MAYNASSGSRNFGDIKFEDDTDTQLDWSADSIAFKTNDVTRFVIDNDGIGVATSPSAPLHVYKAATSQKHTPDELLRLEQKDEGVDMSAGHGPALTFYVGETGGSDHGGSIAVVREAEGDADSAAAMSFYTAGDDSAPTEKARITSTGKFGIGTAAPTHELTVAGAISGSSTLKVVGAAQFGSTIAASGSITAGTSFVIGSADMSEADLEKLDGITGGTVIANKAVVVDGSKNIATLGTVGCGAITSTGASTYGSLAGGAISGSSTLKVVGAAQFGSTIAASGSITTRDDILPFSDNTKNLGSAAKRWANIYTGDLHLKNERGDWTVVEEEEYLSLRNNKTGKRYKLSMEEID